MNLLRAIWRFVGPAIVVIVGLVLAVLVVYTGPTTVPDASTKAIPFVDAVAVRFSSVEMTVSTHGTVVPKAESNLVSEVSGTVTSISPSLVSGGFFAKGDVLVEIERVDYEAALEQALALRASATGDLKNAERVYERRGELVENSSISLASRDEATALLTAARASVRDAAARVARAERDLERTQLVAPFDGRVRTEQLDVGQFVNRGEAVATLYSIDYAEVRLPVHDEELAYLPISLAKSEDPPVDLPTVRLRARFAGADRVWHGQVVRTEGELDPQTRMVNVVAQVPAPYEQRNGNPPLTVGLFVEAEIVGNLYDDVVELPRAALQRNERVYVVDPSGRLEFRDVGILRVIGDRVYVNRGLREFELVCVDALGDAIEGQQVQVKTALGVR